jgi:hypothetical protein
MQALEILNKEEQTIDIEESHMAQIKEYLTLLDLVAEVDLVSLPNTGNSNKQTIITQPGMRYSQAEEIIKNIVLDNKFNELSAIDRKKIIDRLLSEIMGRMMEDIVLFETKVFNPDKLVFKLQFDVGEFDMVIFDSDKICCEIFEIKHSTELVPKQYQHLNDEEKCRITEHHYGPIKRKSVIYRGDTTEENGIHYINVEKYLNHLV